MHHLNSSGILSLLLVVGRAGECMEGQCSGGGGGSRGSSKQRTDSFILKEGSVTGPKCAV